MHTCVCIKLCGRACAAGAVSTLAAPVQDIVRRIFDVEEMKRALLEFEIDTNKMPLGKLTKEHLRVR